MPSRTSSLGGVGVVREQVDRRHDHAGRAVPALQARGCSWKACCTGCSWPSAARPSIVVTSAPSACTASTEQDFTLIGRRGARCTPRSCWCRSRSTVPDLAEAFTQVLDEQHARLDVVLVATPSTVVRMRAMDLTPHSAERRGTGARTSRPRTWWWCVTTPADFARACAPISGVVADTSHRRPPSGATSTQGAGPLPECPGRRGYPPVHRTRGSERFGTSASAARHTSGAGESLRKRTLRAVAERSVRRGSTSPGRTPRHGACSVRVGAVGASAWGPSPGVHVERAPTITGGRGDRGPSGGS